MLLQIPRRIGATSMQSASGKGFFMNRRNMMLLCGLSALTALSGLPVSSQSAETESLIVSDAFVRATPKASKVGAGYATIRSTGQADRLVAFRSPVSTRPELHTHINDGGIMRMRQVEAIEVPAGGEVVLQPGGLHMMFMGLSAPLVEGETVEVVLVFEKAGEIAMTMPVKGMRATH